MPTYGELHLRPPPRAPTKQTAPIGPIRPLQSPRRPKDLLPQHLADGKEGWSGQ
jgi:hypothetical protein